MGMLNVSPIGRNCSQEERDEFERYDKVIFALLNRLICAIPSALSGLCACFIV